MVGESYRGKKKRFSLDSVDVFVLPFENIKK